MASAPPRAASQRRSATERRPSSSSTQLPNAHNESFSSTSEDSQTLLLSRRPSTRTNDPNAEQASTSQTSANLPSEPPHEPRKCWICFNDEDEDTPMSSEWRSPCPCALTAHESCLLDWIADMEAPNPRRRAGSAKSQILCPQCKSEIHLSRPRSYVVDGVRKLDKLTDYLVLPGIATALGFTFYEACHMHGVSTIYLIFGIQDGARILAPLHRIPSTQSVVWGGLLKLAQDWRLTTGLFLIPGLLVASRTTFADSILPVLPMVYFASYDQSSEDLSLGTWPPSAALAFGLLPYVRGAYNLYYEKVWRAHELRWIRAIQPRAGEADDTGGDVIGDDAVQLEVNIGLEADWGGFGGQDDGHADGQAAPGDEAAADHNEPAQEPAPGVPPPGPRQPRAQAAGNMLYVATHFADTMLGALIFPSIAAAVGELLRASLPRAWVTAPSSGKVTGLLQARWGRSLVGGAMFVTVRDAVMLYVRWRMAQNHRKRKVLDWDKKKKTTVKR